MGICRDTTEDGNILKQFGAAVKAGRDELRISPRALAGSRLHRAYVLEVGLGRRSKPSVEWRKSSPLKLFLLPSVEAASILNLLKNKIAKLHVASPVSFNMNAE